jgi:carbon-monoxide dehydrogenase iron sulfur subunit
MRVSEILIHPEKCVGCRICQLTCSFLYNEKYSLALSRIRLYDIYGLTPKIDFSEECNKCGQCARYCLYGALEIIEVNEG